MSKEVCKIIQHVDANISFDSQSQNYTLKNSISNDYCPPVEGNETGQCNNDDQKVSSAFIGLVHFLNGIDNKENIERNKLAQYAALWLSCKLNQKAQNSSIKLNDFYTNHIITNEHYNEKINSDNMINKDLIDNKINYMNMNIKDIPKFYEAVEILCKMYNACNEKSKKCTNCSENAEEFAEKYKELNEGSNNNRSNLYKNILYNLSTDYNNLKKYISENCNDSIDISSFPEVEAPQGSFQMFEATSSSPIASKLIPVLLIFSAIPIFLGIAYKYSLFGFDKRIHRQYLRGKIKKIEKKMNNYI
ncbi:CIR protein PIR protein [Plasmodium vinckei brucechwatti]|uniref:CIR protein PIR protein n=1 Tax=Plasmodium vinckei brucechwatti TaxID=119398 RepID=A0A6V7SCJ5_PLAVN|nr:CIR protein PIR protein [Plasmodium vinckei brucechwatti]